MYFKVSGRSRLMIIESSCQAERFGLIEDGFPYFLERLVKIEAWSIFFSFKLSVIEKSL